MSKGVVQIGGRPNSVRYGTYITCCNARVYSREWVVVSLWRGVIIAGYCRGLLIAEGWHSAFSERWGQGSLMSYETVLSRSVTI